MTAIKMKELEAQSGVGREAIRFYIREGLLPQPEKPKRNVALYREEHLIKLKLIKKIQEEKFYPLSEIKSLLEHADLSNLTATSNLAEFEVAFHSIVDGESIESDLPIEEACQETGFSQKDLKILHKNGTISLQGKGKQAIVPAEDVAILRNWSKVMDLGYRPEDGFNFGLLQKYADSVREVAKLELDLFLSAYANLPTGESAQMGASGMELANSLLKQFHTKAINQALRDRVEKDASEPE